MNVLRCLVLFVKEHYHDRDREKNKDIWIFLNSLILIKLQVVKQRMQTGQFASPPDAVRLIVSKEGFKGLYAVCLFVCFLHVSKLHLLSLSCLVSFYMLVWSKCVPKLQGYGSFLLRDLPFDAIQFCIYEQLRIGYKKAVSIPLSEAAKFISHE